MEGKRTSLFSNGLIWFGAGVSIAEILTGTYFAGLGFQKGLLAIILGHVIGCAMLFAAGLIGGRTRKSAMETVKMSFGQKGSLLFSFLNVLQLVGWTAIMIYDGAAAANGIFGVGAWVWCLVIGGLIIIWILIGISNLGKINTVAMAALFILTLILCKVIFFDGNSAGMLTDDSLSFGAAVELAVAMPLSWLPLISDYTREAEKPFGATLVSTVVYGIISCWMYVIGMGASIYTGESDIAQIMVRAGLGIAGLLIIVFSTVTTTFLDAYSAGVSSVSISKKINEKWAAIAVAAVGTIGAIVYPMDNITDFLYLIGSVFAPMIAIQIADYFIIKRNCVDCRFGVRNLLIWLFGFIAYRYLMTVDIAVGNTLPDMAVTILVCVLVNAAGSRRKQRSSVN
ncbi:putative hydroxymethylpyrimidine transporter CytX [Hespellia stercorisuis]|uniref:Putative hydroxymethylpyrimidine transporter CytX n=1 Tax=Hespellia stercorisuis DSM 15480 TaxID=1121950 RepID=A0A1M6IJU1_9FIRM|nr:putative hydroxymethylpyrimidine transporter CytX [Hespellia stercorisuis]SHJ34708.1 putative hydroxymethylpyrimidine transporter CytX [Hespellia stercorisuis DSM 15480]